MNNLNELLNQSIEFESAPADLCLKCGRCCKSIICDIPREKVVELAQKNEEEAKVFLNIFKPYESLEDAIEKNKEHVENVISKLKKNKNFKQNKILFYYCPYLSDENHCTIYARRPECCKRAPINGWSLFPQGCGYEGWQFQQREKHKEYVRKLKEALYEIDMLVPSRKINMMGLSAKEIKMKIELKLEEYERYGAKNW